MPKYQRLGLSARHAFVGLDVHRTSRIFPHRGNEPIKAIQRRVTGAILEAGVLDSLGSPPVGVGHHMVMEILPCGDGCEQGVQSLAARMALYVEVLYGAAAGAMRGDVA
ncbi:MAG: hypothetical protein Q7T82_10065 [Armatimonadota bacterium]|nr:hypothetical protein [Armatimonadota bacterium]